MNHHDEASMAEGPIPEERELEGCHGVAVVLSDGRPWLLHPGGLLNALDDLRDKIDDSSRMSGKVDMAHVREAAYRLLAANYELSVEEAVALIRGADPDALVGSVGEAIFGPSEQRRTFTTWAGASLIANGIDPDSVPTPLLAQVLDILTATGRTIPLDKYIDSAVAAKKVAGWRARVIKKAPPPEPTPEPSPEPPPEATS